MKKVKLHVTLSDFIKSIFKEITFFRIFMLLFLWAWLELAAYDYYEGKSHLNYEHKKAALEIWFRPDADSIPVSKIIEGKWQQVCLSEKESKIYTLHDNKLYSNKPLAGLPVNYSPDLLSGQCIDREYAIFQKKEEMFFLRKAKTSHE